MLCAVVVVSLIAVIAWLCAENRELKSTIEDYELWAELVKKECRCD